MTEPHVPTATRYDCDASAASTWARSCGGSQMYDFTLVQYYMNATALWLHGCCVYRPIRWQRAPLAAHRVARIVYRYQAALAGLP